MMSAKEQFHSKIKFEIFAIIYNLKEKFEELVRKLPMRKIDASMSTSKIMQIY